MQKIPQQVLAKPYNQLVIAKLRPPSPPLYSAILMSLKEKKKGPSIFHIVDYGRFA